MKGLDHLRPWIVPVYFTAGGLAGALLTQGGLAQLTGTEHPELPGVRDCLATPLLVLSGTLLTLDLTHPLRFFRLLVTFRPTSAVSWGTWILTASGVIAGLLTLDRFAGGWGGTGLSQRLAAAGALIGLGLSGYTGVLLTAAARRRWNATDLMGGIFLTHAHATAAALCLPVCPVRGRAIQGALAAGLLATSVGLLRRHLKTLEADILAGRDESIVPPASGRWLRYYAGFVALTLAGLFSTELDPSGPGPLLAAVSILASDLSMRLAIFWMEEGP